MGVRSMLIETAAAQHLYSGPTLSSPWLEDVATRIIAVCERIKLSLCSWRGHMCATMDEQMACRCGERNHIRSFHSTAGSLVFKILGPAGLGQAALYYRFSTNVKAFSAGVCQLLW